MPFEKSLTLSFSITSTDTSNVSIRSFDSGEKVYNIDSFDTDLFRASGGVLAGGSIGTLGALGARLVPFRSVRALLRCMNDNTLPGRMFAFILVSLQHQHMLQQTITAAPPANRPMTICIA